MEAYVINLKSNPERWKTIKKHFIDSDIKLIRIDAVKSDYNGSHGCFLSFIKALKLAKRKRLPNVLILEDDCLPVNGWQSKWKKIKTWLDANPEKWNLYSGGAHHIQFAKEIGRKDGIIYYDPFWSVAAHWIYIPERCYDILLQYYEIASTGTAIVPIMGVDFHNNMFKTIISYPFIAYQESGHSDINKTYRNTAKLFKTAERGLRVTRKR